MEKDTSELKAAKAVLETFVYAASHDLKEPLRTVLIYAELLQEELAEPEVDVEKVRAHIQYMRDAAAHGQTMVSELLQLSQIGVDLKKEMVDLDDVVKRVVSALELLVVESGAKISCVPSPPFYADPNALAVLLQNLIHNAIKFSKDMGRPVEIEIGAEATEKGWHLWVSDTGPGIPPQHQKAIFVPFRRLDRKTPGVGLGLAICQRVAQAHGGDIWVESLSTQGATFHVEVPVKEGDRDAHRGGGGGHLDGHGGPQKSFRSVSFDSPPFLCIRGASAGRAVGPEGPFRLAASGPYFIGSRTTGRYGF